jgi:transposase
MTMISEQYVGIDVSKDKLDVAIWGQKSCWEVPTLKKGIARLVKQMLARAPRLIVMEATGG